MIVFNMILNNESTSELVRQIYQINGIKKRHLLYVLFNIAFTKKKYTGKNKIFY